MKEERKHALINNARESISNIAAMIGEFMDGGLVTISTKSYSITLRDGEASSVLCALQKVRTKELIEMERELAKTTTIQESQQRHPHPADGEVSTPSEGIGTSCIEPA